MGKDDERPCSTAPAAAAAAALTREFEQEKFAAKIQTGWTAI
jgi:hypothetical protein